MREWVESLENRWLLSAADATLFAIADAHARDGSYAQTNYGASDELQVKNSIAGYQREAFLKFDLRTLGDDISSAHLRLFARLSQSAPGVQMAAYGSNSGTWTEGGLNWNNRPTTNTGILDRQTVVSNSEAWYDFDVTGFVQQQKSVGAEFVTLALKNIDGNNSYTIFRSDEAAAARPELRVVSAPKEPGFVVSDTILRVPEGGSASFSVQLAAQPGTNVGANLVLSGDTSFSASRTAVQFTPANWNVPQTITIRASQDADQRNGVASVDIVDVDGVRATNGVHAFEQDDDQPIVTAPVVRRAESDAYARDGTPTTNYGSESELLVKDSISSYNREAYLRFDISNYPNLASARLRVFGKLTQATSGVFTAVYGAANNWAEGSLTWNNRPAELTGALASQSVSGTAGQWYEFDVTSFVAQQRAAGASVVTLALKNIGGNSSFTVFNSDEAASNQPQLVLSANASARPARPTEPYQPYDVISWLEIGHSAPLDADRHVGYGIKQHGGWTWFVNNTIQAEYDWGVRRFAMHNPFGTLAGEYMQFDQYLHAQDAGLNWLTKDFVSAWSTWISAHPDAEVIAYIGTLDFQGEEDPDFARYDAPELQHLWLKRAIDSLSPLIDSGISIAFDTGGRYAEGSAPYNLMRLVESLGVRIYTEPVPFLSATHLHDLPSMALFDGDQLRDSYSYLPEEQIWIMGDVSPRKGETQADAIVRNARDALSHGWRPAIRVSDITSDPAYQGIMRYKKLSDILQ